jgi:hypothetical protein
MVCNARECSYCGSFWYHLLMLITPIGTIKVSTVIISCAFSNDVLYCLLKVHAIWLPSGTCFLVNSFEARDNITVSVAGDIVLLVIMLWGLLRSRQTQYGIVRHLYLQVGGARFLPRL